MASSSYEYYLSEILGSWAGNPILPSQWLVLFHFNTLPLLAQNFENALSRKEYGQNWKLSSKTRNKLISDTFQYSLDSMVGCAFAKQVNTPRETLAAQNRGLAYGGYMAPATSDTRASYDNLTIDFLETNGSFVDFFIRPWLILSSYYGLVARGVNSPKNVKCGQVDVFFYAKTGPYTSMVPRKIFSYKNVVPIGVGQETYSHQADALKIQKVNFVYDKYSISEGETGSQINKGYEDNALLGFLRGLGGN
jgi:hypothetical protein